MTERYCLAAHDNASGVTFERRPAHHPDGRLADGLFDAWITLDNPARFNAYTTDMLRGMCTALAAAGDDPAVVAVVLTGAGTKAFCSGGDVGHYAAHFAGNPPEFSRYMRLYGSVITALLDCPKPTVCRVNGMRLGGGQEFGLACDFSIASDLALFAQGGVKLGSAQEGGITDFLPLFVGVEAALNACTVDAPWSAYKALRLGMITDAVPVLNVDGEVLCNPLVRTDAYVDGGRIVYGEGLSGEPLRAAKTLLKSGTVDLTPLDARVAEQCAKLLELMPATLEKAVLSLRKHKADRWHANKDANRQWMAANAATEAGLGFRAFVEGPKSQRFIDHAELRRALAVGEPWSAALIERLIPRDPAL
jgi:6-oxo-cyclohex-1-ene-carbonyl-CoA hydrolase